MSFAALSESPAAVQFHVETPVVAPGDTLVLALQIAEPVDFYYAGFEVGFDSGTFSLLDVQQSGLSSPGLSVSELIRPNRLGASVSRISQLAEPASGPVALIRFRVDTAAVPGPYSFELFALEVAASDGQDLPVTSPDPLSIAVEEPEPEYLPSAFVLAAFDLNDRVLASEAQFVNRNAELEVFGASFVGFSAGFEGQAANSNSWMGGSDGSAFWQISLSTQGFRDVTVSSRQFGSGSGPRDFLLYGSIDMSEWIQLSPDTIRLSSTSWNAAFINKLALPAGFYDQPSVTLRWVMASEARIDTGLPMSSSAGTSRIDDINVLGYQLNPAFVDVWPGDTNNDGIVNADDVLPLGIYWMHRGLAPFVGGTDFAARTVEQWVPAGASYADTNGDGIVDHRDLQWIGMHFGESRLGKVKPGGGLIAGTGAGDGSAESGSAGAGGSSTASAGSVARMVLNENLTMGQEFRIGLFDDARVDLQGAAWRVRIHGADSDKVALIMPPVPGNVLAFMTSPEEGVIEGALVLKNNGRSDAVGFQIELFLQIYDDLEGSVELELERMTVVDVNGSIQSASFPVLKRLDAVSRWGDDAGSLPQQVRLEANYPNPFNPTTNLRFSLPETMPVRLEVFDMTGRLVAVPTVGVFSAGNHVVTFDGSGRASGVYVYRLSAGGELLQGKMTLVK